MAENNKIGKEQYLEHLNRMIFDNEMLFLSEPNIGTKGCVFTLYDKIIAGTFCEKTNVHGEKLKKILLLGYMENNKIEHEERMKNGEDQGIVDIWID